MTEYPTISFRDLIKKVEAWGFVKVRQKGSHIRFTHSDGRQVTIPDHGGKDVPKGLLVKIVKYDLEMTMEDFFTNPH